MLGAIVGDIVGSQFEWKEKQIYDRCQGVKTWLI